MKHNDSVHVYINILYEYSMYIYYTYIHVLHIYYAIKEPPKLWFKKIAV